MVEFKITGEALWSRMECAVEKVNERLRRTVDILEEAKITYAVDLPTLVCMKLNAFQRKDQVHLLDMISLGMIDEAWLDRFPDRLRRRLRELLDDPDG